MGVKVQAIIEHQLSPNELELIIAKLEARFSPGAESMQSWRWTNNNISSEFLEDYWKRPTTWYMNTPWSEQDIALIYGPDHFSIHLFKPNFIAVINWTSLNQFQSDEQLKQDFKTAIRTLASVFDSDTFIFIQEIGIVGLPDAVNEHRFNSMNELIGILEREQAEFER